MNGSAQARALAALAFIIITAPAFAAPPTKLGQCAATTLKEIGYRLQEGPGGPGVKDSGSRVEMADGGHQVSYEPVPGVRASRVGDPVLVCVSEVETGCPPNETGYTYRTTNRRTGATWSMGGSTKMCSYPVTPLVDTKQIGEAAVSAVREIVARNLSTVLTMTEKEGHDRKFFVRDLYELFMRNAREFNADPYTGVQDTMGFVVASIGADVRSPERVDVTVTYGQADDKAFRMEVRYEMRLLQGRWLIHDIIYITENNTSMRASLRGKKPK